jgi:hypothetical protein
VLRALIDLVGCAMNPNFSSQIVRLCQMMLNNTVDPVPNQDPTQDGFLMRLRTKNQNNESHKKTVESYDQFFVDRSSLDNNDEAVEKRREGSDVLTNHFYNLVTDFYEYGML